jgi:hypothetical protein
MSTDTHCCVWSEHENAYSDIFVFCSGYEVPVTK